MRNQKVICNLLFILFLDIIAFSSILPLFPSILNYYATKSLKGDLYQILSNTIKSYCQAIGLPDNERLISVFFGGALGSLFSGLQFISSPWFGAMSDAYGRKRMLLISLAGTFTSYLLWSCASSFGIFMLSRIIGGLSKASTSISIAIVADLFPPEERGKGMAFVGLAFSSGFVIGPTLGAIAAYWNRMKTISIFTPAYFALLITSIEILWVWIFLKETLPEVKKKKDRNLVSPQFFSYINPASLFVFKPLEKRIEQKASGIVVPCLTTEVSSQVSPTEKGSVLGIFRALGSLARAIGPVCASTVFWLFGDTITYIIGGLLMFVPLYLNI
ncbi:Major facilitator superfamily domain-containing protein 10 [Trichinella pseudospiralis]|uniref:Major facilitator superfamily domain-containing protein 10 n=1 Tax=Trichinella pseudospiralis TaxID=6337 RepID=A0A0V1K5J6_TRIPS|nr:Major facilitator superfamily domain-containing protein 10 [Trichinella pseudospiralis]